MDGKDLEEANAISEDVWLRHVLMASVFFYETRLAEPIWCEFSAD